MKIIKKVLLGILATLALVLALGIGMAACETPEKAEAREAKEAAETQAEETEIKLNECAQDIAVYLSSELGMSVNGGAASEESIYFWIVMPYSRNVMKMESTNTYDSTWSNIAEYSGSYCLDNGLIAKSITVYFTGAESATDWVVKSTGSGTQFAED